MQDNESQKAQKEKREHEEFDERLNRYMVRHIWKLIGYLGYIALIVGFAFIAQARTEHQSLILEINRLAKQVEEKTGETEEIRDYLQIIEKGNGNLLNYFQQKKDAEIIKKYDDLLKELQSQKLIYENRRLQKEK